MSLITIVRPDADEPDVAKVPLAARATLPDRPVIGLIANGKPHASEMLHELVAELEARIISRLKQTL